jgi:hypothetical protein
MRLTRTHPELFQKPMPQVARGIVFTAEKTFSQPHTPSVIPQSANHLQTTIFAALWIEK